MGALMGSFGLGGTDYAKNIQAPNLQRPVGLPQTQTAYDTAQGGLTAQQQLLAALQGQGGMGNQQQIYGQLQDVIAGRGPNPAQAALAQSTGQNVANQAALMAGQRGAGANIGLMARQAAQQGGALQQQAAGQAATLQAQQSLGALGQAQNLATTQAQQQIGATEANAQLAQSEQQALLNAMGQQNQAQVASQGNLNQVYGNLAGQQMGQKAGLLGGIGNAVGTVLKPVGEALGKGLVDALPWGGLAEGGEVSSAPALPANSTLSRILARRSNPMSAMADGGKVPALVSPGEKYLSPNKVEQVKQGASPLHVGETIPGAPKVGGAVDSYANDTVPKTLEEGGIVLPRSVTKSKNSDAAAQRFVETVLAKKKGKSRG